MFFLEPDYKYDGFRNRKPQLLETDNFGTASKELVTKLIHNVTKETANRKAEPEIISPTLQTVIPTVRHTNEELKSVRDYGNYSTLDCAEKIPDKSTEISDVKTVNHEPQVDEPPLVDVQITKQLGNTQTEKTVNFVEQEDPSLNNMLKKTTIKKRKNKVSSRKAKFAKLFDY